MSKLIYNESTKKWEDIGKAGLIHGVVYWNDNYIEFGDFDKQDVHKEVYFEEIGTQNVRISENIPKLYFNRITGEYTIKEPRGDYFFENGEFPYNFERFYSTRYLENSFHSKHIEDNTIKFNFIDELPYTFGLEFETNAGYIPEDELYKAGLIPLRDGSIAGLEYSTIVLQGNDGLNTLKKQLSLLDKYTIFDKDCSLHIHFGNFKLSPEVLLRLNNLFTSSDINRYAVPWAFTTGNYKSNGKEYCIKNSIFEDFESLYSSLVGRHFYGDLYQPHPSDISGDRKWNILTRYKALNLINAVCYNNAKTAEFRFLRPTYNFDKILIWVFVLGAFIKYAENTKIKKSRYVGVPTILFSVYSEELARTLCQALSIQKYVIQKQSNTGDLYGMRIDIEDKIMSYKNLSKNVTYFY